MIDQKNIAVGTLVAVFLLFILGKLITVPTVGGIISNVLALILAGIVVGYLVNNSVKIGAIHGALVGLFTGIIYILLIYAVSGFSEKVIGFLIIFSIWTIPLYILLGVGGGILGAVIKLSRQQKKVPKKEVISKEEVTEESPKKDEEE